MTGSKYAQIKVEERLLMRGRQTQEQLERLRMEKDVDTTRSVDGNTSVSPHEFLSRQKEFAEKIQEKKVHLQAKIDAQFTYHPSTISQAEGNFKER